MEALADRAKQSLSILKVLTGTNWGQQKETIVRAGQELVPGTSSFFRNFRWNEVPFWKVELVPGTSSFFGCFLKVPSSSSFINTCVLNNNRSAQTWCNPSVTICIGILLSTIVVCLQGLENLLSCGLTFCMPLVKAVSAAIKKRFGKCF